MLKLCQSLIPLVVLLVVPLVLMPSITFSQDPAPKLAVPGDAAQKAALAVVADVYKPDYEKAKTSAQKIELAKKLLAEGIATKDDPISRFVLFRIARDIAAQQGDLVTAFDAIGRIGTEYDADTLQMKVDAATTATKALKLPRDHQACAALLALLIDDAIAVDRYDHAKSLVALTLGSAREGRDFALIKQMTSKLKEVEEVATEFEIVKAAKATLEAKPTDPDANLAVGKFLCLFKGDWKRGVTMLALGSNEEFKATAMLELEDKPDALKLGDGWWKTSESLEGTAKARTQSHAGEWYRKALPGLSGLTKARVERLVSQLPTTVVAKDVESANVAEVRPVVPANPQLARPMPQTKRPASEAKPNVVWVLPEKSEDVLAKSWNLPKNASDWQIVNGGLRLPGRVRNLESAFSLAGDCEIIFSCSTAGWRGPSVKLFGESISLPPAEGGFPILYDVQVVRNGTNLQVKVAFRKPGLNKSENTSFDVVLKKENSEAPTKLVFQWPADIDFTVSKLAVTEASLVKD